MVTAISRAPLRSMRYKPAQGFIANWKIIAGTRRMAGPADPAQAEEGPWV